MIAIGVASLPWVRAWFGAQRERLVDIAGRDELAQLTGPGQGDGSGAGSGAAGSGVVADDAHVLRGRVTRPNGEPASQAVVVATCADDGSLVEAVTDAGGMFEAYADDCLYAIEATKEGFGPAIIAGVRPSSRDLLLLLTDGVSIDGLVLRGQDPVANATVHLGGAGVFPQRVAQTDANGRFRIFGLRPGNYRAFAAGADCGSPFGQQVIVPDVGAGERVRLELECAPAPGASLSIVERSSGAPVEDAVLSIADGPLHVMAVQERVAGGIVVLPYLPAGTYFMRLRAGGFLPWEGLVTVSDSSDTITVELSRGATVSGSVVDLAGNPVGGARLTAFVQTPEGGRWEMRRNLFDDFHRLVRPDGAPFWTLDTGYVTDASGQFALSGIPAGEAVVVANRGGLAPAFTSRLTVQRDATYEGIRLVMSPGRSVRGRVEDSGGSRVVEAWVGARPAGVPDWAAPEPVPTDSFGMFRLDDQPEAVRIDVRHSEFAPAALDLSLPVGGLDDLVIRLSGDQAPELRGRVFAADGAAAFGATVWIMHGQSDIPACRASVGLDGWFAAQGCSATPERILVSHPEHAVLSADLGTSTEPRDWHLLRGGEIEVITQRLAVLAQIEPVATVPSALWAPQTLTLDRWARQPVRHLAAGRWRVVCRAEGYEDAVVEVDVADQRRVEAMCPFMYQRTSMQLYVVDAQGAPVGGALVMIDGSGPEVRELTGADGSVRWQGEPGRRVRARAMHEAWGTGRTEFVVPFEPEASPPRVVLDQSVAGDDPEAFLAQLRDWGVVAVVDGRSVVVDRAEVGTPGAGVGLRRGDRLLWAQPAGEQRLSIGLRRGAEVLTFELVRSAAER